MFPFDQTDLPRAERTVAAPVEAVYRTIEDVESWPAWAPRLQEPVRRRDGAYELDATVDGRIVTHRLAVTSKGPVHTLFFDVDDGSRGLYFRTRPAGPTSRIEVVVTPDGVGTRRGMIGRRRRDRQVRTRLEGLLESLAAHVEAGGGTAAGAPS